MAKPKTEVVSDRETEVKKIAQAQLDAILSASTANVKLKEDEDSDPDKQ